MLLNRLCLLYFPTPRFPGDLNFLSLKLKYRQMDSFGRSVSRHMSRDAPLCGNSVCGDEECLRRRDHKQDVIMVGKIHLCLKCNRDRLRQKPSLCLPDHKCDNIVRTEASENENVHRSDYEEEFPQVSKHREKRNRLDSTFERDLKNINKSLYPSKRSSVSYNSNQWDEQFQPNHLGNENKRSYFWKHELWDVNSSFQPFDICRFGRRRSNSKNSRRPEANGSSKIIRHVDEVRETKSLVLGPGMVLLKHYITPSEEVNIVNTCRNLGVGRGGFYRPGYKDGRKLRLQMMCLGLDWDPQTKKYGDIRAVDGDRPPQIPFEFAELVQRSLIDAQALIENETKAENIEDILPSMSPDICIVNFYTTNGKLGLHQDRDESEQSLCRGLPVVSFSVGNSAEFLYGKRRDVDEAKKVILESGDVLIFGGESRHVFHGVSSILADTAPEHLLYQTGLSPGRLNLTFRKY